MKSWHRAAGVIAARLSRWLLALQVLSTGCHSPHQNTANMNNKETVRQAFEQWKNGTGNFFDLLSEEVQWTITGNSPVSKTYTSKKQFLQEVIDPLNDKLSGRIIPSVQGLYAEGDMVIALWEGTAMAKDSVAYHNTYSWYMTFRDGRIIRVVAFFDTITFTDIWERVPHKASGNR